MKLLRLCTPLVLCSALLAQEFEIATIKPSAPGTIAKSFHFTPGGGLQTTGSTLKDLIVHAYDIRADQIQGGPPWVAVDRYDVTAKAATEGEGLLATLTEDNRQKWTQLTRLRTRAILASRFNLAVHQETREFAIYELRVDKNGPKADGLKESNANLGTNFLGNVILGNGGDMHDLVMILGPLLQKPIVDKTELTDKYDFTLRWTPDQLLAVPRRPDLPSAVPRVPTGDLDKLPSIFTALREQLGLRLDSTKGALEVIVIDRAERPSDN